MKIFLFEEKLKQFDAIKLTNCLWASGELMHSYYLWRNCVWSVELCSFLYIVSWIVYYWNQT